MRIGIDAHALATGAGGNETYVRQLLQALREYGSGHAITALVGPQFSDDSADAAGFPLHRLATRSSYVRVPLALPLAARRLRLDLLHAQYIAPPYCPCPFVVSVHDIVWKRYPESLRAVDRYRLSLLVPNTLRRAARVFVLTEAMKHEIAEAYRVPLDRFDLVQPSVDPIFGPVKDEALVAETRRRYDIPPDYVLYVGALQPRKNLTRLARAFARLRGRGLSHSLVIVGKRAWLYGTMLDEIEGLDLGDRLRFTGYVDREDLPALFSGAAAFAYIPLYEGFGLPVLEAIACETPVLASADPAIREIAEDAAQYCDPLNVDAIEDGLCNLLTDNALRERLRRHAADRASAFSYERMAMSALRGYEKAVL